MEKHSEPTSAALPAPRPGLPLRAIESGFRVLSQVAPGLKPRVQVGLIRIGYTLVNALIDRRRADVAFLNYGYAPLPGEDDPLVLDPADRGDEYGIRLYHRVTTGAQLAGKQLLEVGSGRGGGASFMMRYLSPKSVTGVDFAPAAIRFARRRHSVAGLTFEQGDAQQLPFPAESFDAVVNVESSHCYPSFERFLNEVRRVLRPGGEFMFADLRPRDEVGAMRHQLAAAFEVVKEECITPNVFRALELCSQRTSDLIDASAPTLLRTPMRNLAAVHGTMTYEMLRNRELDYVRFVLRRHVSGP